MVDKPHADGAWTAAQFATFIRNQLRRGWVKWPIKNSLLKEARVERGKYQCSCCGEVVPSTMKIEGKTVAIKKVKGVNVDHILPATPLTGEYIWDDFIHRLYCEKDNLWVICYFCHEHKTQLVEKPLIKLLKALQKGEDPFPVQVGRYTLKSLSEAHTDPEKHTFTATIEGGDVEVDIPALLASNGGIKKGEKA